MNNKTLTVITDRCPQNHPCPSIEVCPVNALSQRGYDAPDVDLDLCISCGKCTDYCPMNALVLN